MSTRSSLRSCSTSSSTTFSPSPRPTSERCGRSGSLGSVGEISFGGAEPGGVLTGSTQHSRPRPLERSPPASPFDARTDCGWVDHGRVGRHGTDARRPGVPGGIGVEWTGYGGQRLTEGAERCTCSHVGPSTGAVVRLGAEQGHPGSDDPAQAAPEGRADQCGVGTGSRIPPSGERTSAGPFRFAYRSDAPGIYLVKRNDVPTAVGEDLLHHGKHWRAQLSRSHCQSSPV